MQGQLAELQTHLVCLCCVIGMTRWAAGPSLPAQLRQDSRIADRYWIDRREPDKERRINGQRHERFHDNQGPCGDS